jgi:ABC-type sugar transport system substrate-binding protein
LQQFDIGVYSGVDGIIVATYNADPYMDAYRNVLIRANELGIPVVTLNQDIANVEKVSHIAFNQYRIGSRIGFVLNKGLLLGGTIVVLQDEGNLQDDKARGIYENVTGEYEVKTVTIESEGENIFNAEGLTRQIINEYSDLRAIVCTNSDVTMGVVQAIKDTNKVGNIIVVGNDITEDIKDYIDKEVIFATVIADYRKLGYIAIETLVQFNQGEFVSSYPTIEVIIPSKDNINTYLEEAGLAYEETDQEN